MDTGTTSSLRLFYALWPDDATRAALQQLQAPMDGRQTRYGNLHLTLAFLGQQPAELVPVLTKILEALPPTPLSLTLNRVGYFTSNRVAWAGMHAAPPALLALRHDLTQELARHHIAFNGRADFRPHVTLVRDASPPEDLPFTPIVWQADEVALVQSTSQPDGVVYRVLASRRLTQNVKMQP
jgi:2'-5' RNA ligase